jgi:hypothetical protein
MLREKVRGGVCKEGALNSGLVRVHIHYPLAPSFRNKLFFTRRGGAPFRVAEP